MAASVPMPRVYLIDDTAPNAFATGRDPQHASVAITTGLLQKLDREELQGVMAHELSHVRNFDIRFSLIVGVLVGSIALLADFFLRFTFWGGGDGGAGASRRTPAAAGSRRSSWSSAIILAILAPDRRAPGADGRQPPARVPRGRLGRGAHPQPVRAGAGARQDHARHRAAGGREPGDPAPLLREPDQGRDRDQPSRCSRRIPPALDRINRLRELTGQPPVADAALVLDPVAQAALLRDARPLGRSRERRARLPPVRGTCYSPARRRAPAGTRDRAEIAQLVEHATENRGVASSNLALGTNTQVGHRAEVAQLVEHHLAKVRVAGSSPVFRSTPPHHEYQTRHRCPFV